MLQLKAKGVMYPATDRPVRWEGRFSVAKSFVLTCKHRWKEGTIANDERDMSRQNMYILLTRSSDLKTKTIKMVLR